MLKKALGIAVAVTMAATVAGVANAKNVDSNPIEIKVSGKVSGKGQELVTLAAYLDDGSVAPLTNDLEFDANTGKYAKGHTGGINFVATNVAKEKLNAGTWSITHGAPEHTVGEKEHQLDVVTGHIYTGNTRGDNTWDSQTAIDTDIWNVSWTGTDFGGKTHAESMDIPAADWAPDAGELNQTALRFGTVGIVNSEMQWAEDMGPTDLAAIHDDEVRGTTTVSYSSSY